MDGVPRYRLEHDVKLLLHGSFLAEFLYLCGLCRVTELKFAKDQGLCTTLIYVAFTDSECLIGDVVCYPQNTTFDACCVLADADDGASALAAC